MSNEAEFIFGFAARLNEQGRGDDAFLLKGLAYNLLDGEIPKYCSTIIELLFELIREFMRARRYGDAYALCRLVDEMMKKGEWDEWYEEDEWDEWGD